MKIRDVLKAKGPQVYCIAPEQTMQEAVALLVEHRVGSLVVLDGRGRLAGIVTERDVLRECHGRREDFGRRPVAEVMTRDVRIGVPDDELAHIMAVMTDHRIRHLPVMEGDRLLGIVSIGDVVKACLERVEDENRYLRDYIQAR